jgi:EAL domain-containing protein (putative c-di-GMP-specific phosphodiesterase class I)
VDARHLEIEITESMVMHDVQAAIRILHELKALGVGLSVDDFGTGYSSLSYLRRLPLDTLKIDRTFVHDIADAQEGDGGLLAKAIISLGHSLKLKIIAEGVENDAELEFLKAHACDQVQGFYFSKPVSAEEFVVMLRSETEGASAPALPELALIG